MSTPLLRWTVGECSDLGIEILEESIRRIKTLYKHLDLLLCYNHDSIPDKTRHLGIKLYRQSHCQEMEYPPINEIWKLYPPRLNPGGHEIFMDNDIVLFEKCPQIDMYLESDRHALLYEGVHGLHGKYSHIVPDGLKVNSGIFGVPPGFDFSAAIKQVQEQDSARNWEQKWDDQGLVGAILSRIPFFLIEQKQIPCCEPSNRCVRTHKNLHMGSIGFHFVGSNSSNSNEPWNTFKNRFI